MTDQELLHQFNRDDRHEAFKKLVERHSSLVLAVATRILADRAMAEDVTQNVFILLARKAARLTKHPTLVGWLHRTTHFEAAKMRQSATRRQRREQNYHDVMASERVSESSSQWEQVLPHLDHALNKLSLGDRNLILLRFYQKKSFREIANVLGKSEAACRMHGSRAIKKLTKLLGRRGVVLPTAVLTNGFHANYAEAAASHLCPRLTEHALAIATSSQTHAGLQALLASKVAWTAVAITVLVIAVPIARQSLVQREHSPTMVSSPTLVRSSPPPTLTLGTKVQATPATPAAPDFPMVEVDGAHHLHQSQFVVAEERPLFDMVQWTMPYENPLFRRPDAVRLHPTAIAYAAIQDNEVPLLESQVHWLWAEATKLANAHTVIDPLRNEPSAKVRAIRIAPFDAADLLQSFMHRFEAIVGPERALKLLSAFFDHQYFGSFGRLEILAQIDEGMDKPVVRYSRIDPITGRELGSGGGPLSNFEAQYGILATPRAEGPATRWNPIPSEKPHPIEVMDDDRLLTTAITEKVGLTANQNLHIQSSIDQWFNNMSTLMRKHVSQVPNDDPKVTHFVVTPFPTQGFAALQQFQRDIANQIGVEKAEEFLTLLKPEKYFCGCGRNKLEVTCSDSSPPQSNTTYAPGVIPLGESPEDFMWANCKELDPQTNEQIRHGQSAFRVFTNRYGDFLTIE